MRKSSLAAAVVVAGALAMPSGAQAQLLPPLPLPLPPTGIKPVDTLIGTIVAPGGETAPVGEVVIDAGGVVTDTTGAVVGVVDEATGQVLDTTGRLLGTIAATPAPPGGTGGTGGGGTSGAAGATDATGAPGATSTAAASGSPTPASSPSTSAAPDTRRPVLTLRTRAKLRLGAARRRGLTVVARCDEACRVAIRVWAPDGTLRTLGTHRADLRAGVRARLRVTLTPAGRRYVKRHGLRKLAIVGTATDAAGNRSAVARRTTRLAVRR